MEKNEARVRLPTRKQTRFQLQDGIEMAIWLFLQDEFSTDGKEEGDIPASVRCQLRMEGGGKEIALPYCHYKPLAHLLSLDIMNDRLMRRNHVL